MRKSAARRERVRAVRGACLLVVEELVGGDGDALAGALAAAVAGAQWTSRRSAVDRSPERARTHLLLPALFQALLLDLLAQLQQPLDQRLGAGWAAGDVHIDRHQRVHPLHDILAVVELPTQACRLAHRNDPLGFGRPLVEAYQPPAHLSADESPAI